MKKVWIKRTFAIVSMVLALWLMILCFGWDSRDYLSTQAFYLEPIDSLDVVFIGASEVSSDISSVYLYELSGLTSYQISSDSAPATVYLPQLREILSRQKPRLIVVEMNGFLAGSADDLYNDAKIRTFLDPTPLSRRKLDTMERLPLQEDPASYIFPFLKYHTFWAHPRALLNYAPSRALTLARGYSLLKGYITRPVCMDEQALAPIPDEPLELGHEVVWEYLREFTAFCDENDLRVVYARFPHELSSGQEVRAYRRFLTIKNWLTENGRTCLDLQTVQPEIGLRRKDYYNESHLNILGQEKFTAYLSKLLSSEYGLQPRELDGAQRSHWDKCVRFYHRFRRQATENLSADHRFMYEEFGIFFRIPRDAEA